MAEYRHPEVLAATDWLAAHLGDPSVRVVDVRYYVRAASGGSFRGVSGKEAYQEGHIPGAVFVDYAADLSEPEDEVPLNILRPDHFAAPREREPLRRLLDGMGGRRGTARRKRVRITGLSVQVS